MRFLGFLFFIVLLFIIVVGCGKASTSNIAENANTSEVYYYDMGEIHVSSTKESVTIIGTLNTFFPTKMNSLQYSFNFGPRIDFSAKDEWGKYEIKLEGLEMGENTLVLFAENSVGTKSEGTLKIIRGDDV